MSEEGEGSLIYGLELQGRALAPLTADTEAISFVVGTQSLKSENMVYIVTQDEDSGHLHKKVYKHAVGEVWGLDSHPEDPSLLITTYGEKHEGGWRKRAALWKIPAAGEQGESEEGGSCQPVELVTSLTSCSTAPGGGGEEVCGAWFQPNQPSRLALVEGDKVSMIDVNGSQGCSKVWESQHAVRGQTRIENGRWNPHRGCHQFSTVCGSQIISWDSRTGEKAGSFSHTSGAAVRSIDFNPNKQYHLCCGGDDGSVTVWDTRNTTQPLSLNRFHSHWVWSARYNTFHDQLLLSAGSDSRVMLLSQASLSSEPYGQLLEDEDEDEEDKKGRAPVLEDGLIQTFCDHEDSVYTAEWSVADPWVFASLSYDGRLVIGHVPRSVKYTILNLN